MTRIQNILVGVELPQIEQSAASDLPLRSDAAIAEAVRLAGSWDASVTFCSVLERSAESPSLIDLEREQKAKIAEDLANAALSRLVAETESQGIASRGVLRYGTPWEELFQETITSQYDLVVVGSGPESRVAATPFGCTAQKLMRVAACPVWTVKPAELRDIRDVAVATDLSDTSLPAFHLAVSVARAIDARLYVLHVMNFADSSQLGSVKVDENAVINFEPRRRQSVEEQLREQLQQTDFRTLPHGVKIELIEGTADVAIPEFVAINAVDLLVMGTRYQSGLSDSSRDMLAQRILPGLRSSLLTVKPTGCQSPYSE